MKRLSILFVISGLMAFIIMACSSGSGSGLGKSSCTPLFTPTDNWTKSTANPVISSSGSGWDTSDAAEPWVIYNGTTYQMWYTGKQDPLFRIGYATSDDGETWTVSGSNPVLDVGMDGEWDDAAVHLPSVLYNGTSYQMWYTGNDGANQRIGYATSDDGITWTKYAGNPVLDLGAPTAWDNKEVKKPVVLFNGTSYQMWFVGNDGTTSRTGYATSDDGITWTKYAGNPVLDLGASGAWDDTHVSVSTVLSDECGTYHMWYVGHDGSTYRIGHAISNDGITWTRDEANPLIAAGTSGQWDDVWVGTPSVIYNGTGLEMWYGGFSGYVQIGHAIEN